MERKYEGVLRDTDGVVFNVQRFSLDDGPGIRTTLFLKGCSLKCQWCHNPESIRAESELLFFSERCTGCGRCVAACTAGIRQLEAEKVRFDRSKCLGCGKCADVCLTDAIQQCGRKMTIEEAVQLLSRDIPFYKQSGGGVTFSGGEPMLQRCFVAKVAKQLKQKGIHIALDTAGNVPSEWFDEAILSNVDLFLYDVKCMNSQLHAALTGSNNERILSNLRVLSDRGATLWIRLPFVPSLTCTPEEVKQIAALLRTLKGIARIELVPYHAYGERKYMSLDRKCVVEGRVPNASQIKQVLEDFAHEGLSVICDIAGGSRS